MTFSSSNAEPLFVKWSGGADNGTKHISVLTEEEKTAGVAVCDYDMGAINDWQYGQYKVRVAFQTEYGIIHTPLQEPVTVKDHRYSTVVTKPTCEKEGYTTYVCNDCDYSYVTKITAALEHTYDHEFDRDCNVCGTIRKQEALAIVDGGRSISEDVDGLAFRFNLNIIGAEAINGNELVLDNATIYGYKVLKIGAVASNDVSSVDIPVAYLLECDEAAVSFAVRIINIPDANKDNTITAVPYVVLEVDGEQIVVEGEAQSGTFNGVLNG